MGTLLILWAGSGLMYQMWREATTLEGHRLFVRVGDIYQAPSFFLILLVIDRLLLAPPLPRWWKGMLVASAIAVPFFAVFQTDGFNWYTTVPSVVNRDLEYVVQMAAVLLAARVAKDPARTMRERRQSALVGLAFGLLLAHAGAAALGNWFWGEPWLVNDSLLFGLVLKANATVFGALGLAAALYGLKPLTSPFGAGGKAAVGVSLVLTILIGVVSYVKVAGFTVLGGRAIVLSGFALVIGVAIFRYDLASAGNDARLRLQGVSTLVLALCVISLVAVAAWSLLSQGALVLSIALAAVLVPAALLITPLKRLPAWITRRILLSPTDPGALRERVRVYAGTLAAATGPDGGLLPGTQPALAALRRSLGLGPRDHDLLVALGSNQAAGDIVAYRVALAGMSPAEWADEAHLRRLRDDLGVSERDHAFVAEHLAAGADQLRVGARFVGRYLVARRLAEGGFGEVWQARDTTSGDEVVLKRLVGHDRRDGVAARRLRDDLVEGRIPTHPNLLGLRDVEAVGDETFLVMDYMAGGNLAEALRQRGPLPEGEALRLGADVAAGLASLHGRGFVHRDVKPSNILLDGRGLARLADFSIAQQLVSGETVGPGGHAAPAGTFAYMPPEQARGLQVRPDADVFALCATLYEAVSGRAFRAVAGLSHTEATARIVAEGLPAVGAHASPEFARLLQRGLARSPDERFVDAAAFAAALARLTAPGTPARSAPRPRRRPRADRPAPGRSAAS